MLQNQDILQPLVQWILQEVLKAEMTDAIGAGKGERCEGRQSYRSGYYPRRLVTRVGTMELRVPQDRHGRFSTQLFERYQRSEKALVAALDARMANPGELPESLVKHLIPSADHRMPCTRSADWLRCFQDPGSHRIFSVRASP